MDFSSAHRAASIVGGFPTYVVISDRYWWLFFRERVGL